MASSCISVPPAIIRHTVAKSGLTLMHLYPGQHAGYSPAHNASSPPHDCCSSLIGLAAPSVTRRAKRAIEIFMLGDCDGAKIWWDIF